MKKQREIVQMTLRISGKTVKTRLEWANHLVLCRDEIATLVPGQSHRFFPSVSISLHPSFSFPFQRRVYQSSTCAKISGATIDASLWIMNLGVSTASFSQVIFSLGTAPL